MSYILRPIQPQDNRRLAVLIRTVLEEFGIDRPGTVYTDPLTDTLYELFRTEKSSYWIAEEDGEILGGCGVYPTPDLPDGYAELVKYYVCSHQRGKGIGKTLFQHAQNSAAEFGYTHLYLESFPELNTAVSLYKALGFQSIDTPLGNSGHFACTLWMTKAIG